MTSLLVQRIEKLQSENEHLRATILEIARHLGIDDGDDLETRVIEGVRRIVARIGRG